MTLQELRQELGNWKFTRQRIIHLSIGLGALLLYEFVGRPIYRPYIYTHNIFDFHIADTLGNSLGTLTTIFVILGLLGRERDHYKFLIVTTTLAVTCFELAHPLLGKPIDLWDIAATMISGVFSYGICLGLYCNNSTSTI
jgi:hypothetical protein